MVAGRRGVVGSENLLPDGLERVARIRVHEVRLAAKENPRGFRVSGVDEVGFGPINPIDFRVEFLHPASMWSNDRFSITSTTTVFIGLAAAEEE
ncbi:UNVERIFIED_CONTAM: hypothetical protein Sradi_0240700 [Sesamum radiatum]|uniref:Uncharacterized protein n=1 Tax=Sesamum radiatum TaxID=300843 RepID=A0AAW2W1B1_SESRA